MAKEKSKRESKEINYAGEAQVLINKLNKSARDAQFATTLEECQRNYNTAMEAYRFLTENYSQHLIGNTPMLLENELDFAKINLDGLKAKAQLKVDSTLSDAKSDSELSSDARSELESSVSESKSHDERTNQEIKDSQDRVDLSAPSAAPKTSQPPPTLPKPETSKPGLLTRFLNGIRSLISSATQSESKKSTSVSASRTLSRLSEGLPVDEVKQRVEQSKASEKALESKHDSNKDAELGKRASRVFSAALSSDTARRADSRADDQKDASPPRPR